MDELETWTETAARENRRIQRINDCFLSLGTDHQANIERLVQTAGDLLHAACATYVPAHPPRTSPPLPARSDGGSDADHPRDRELQTCIECPVPVGEHAVGSLRIGWAQIVEPSPADLDVLQMLARAIGLQEQMRQRDQELLMLNEIGRVVTSALTLDEMLTLLRSKARDVIGAEACSIALIDPVTSELVFRQADDPLAERVVGRRLRPGQGIAGQVAQTGRSTLIPDAPADPRFYDGVDEETGFSTREIICVPLIVQDKTIGVLELSNKRQGSFAHDDVRLLESVAAQIAAAIENARLNEVTRRELSDRIKAERALRETTRRLQTLIDAAPDLIYLKDRELRYLLVNQAFARAWQVDPGEVTGKTDLDVMPEGQAQANQESDARVIQERRPLILEKQEGERFTETRKVLVVDDEGRPAGVVGITRDVTDRKRLEEQLIREQKEESVLTLAGGIAHDFNNALVGIVGNIDLLRLDLPTIDPEVARTLESMERSAQRMVALTNQLLTYAGGVKPQVQPTSLNALLDETVDLVQGSLAAGIVVRRSQAVDLWEIEANPAQIRQVLVNVLINAGESMADGGGTLDVRTENVHREAWICPLHRQHAEGDYVHLAVSDTGHGMNEEIKKRLFEPFFSTKFMGRGLGLAVALGITRDHGGCIEIASQPERGTTVHIYLPRTQPLLRSSAPQQLHFR